ncbi:MAG TPA: serine/threonine-protein kinase [Thermoanaerobaculia bacterium]|jgi:serine/threonine protein kinase|nr:serine/threonine-protein kinase [Thermoanaerobaculia bacterium]
MSSILVVEPEHRSSERIHAALGAGGWAIRVVGGPGEAQQVAAVERPDLILVSFSVPAADAVAGALSRSSGKPGLVLAPDFTDQELRDLVQRSLPVPAPVPAPAPAPRNVMLTSADIFGDVLAEVEADEPAAPAPPAPAPPPRPAPRPAFDDDEINRKLEKTLSGVMNLGSLGQEPKRPAPAPPPPVQSAPAPPRPPAPAPAPPRRPEPAPDSDVDALLSKTLSTLELGSRPKPAAAPAPPRPAAPPPAAARPSRSDFDISAALDGLTQRRPPAPPPPAAPPAPPVSPAGAATVRVPIPKPAPEAPPPPLPPPIFPEAELLADPLPDISEVFAEPVIEALPELPDLPDLPPPASPPRSVAPVMDVAATQRIQIPPLSVLSAIHEESGDQPGERFGQYTLLEKIAAGGMAEVWKARMRGVEGFQKTVAIKKILPHMTDNSEFVGMFIDEAKLAAQLSHPNIVHIYDLGKIGRDYYIAMEYVEGKDLRSLMNAGRRKGIRLPLALALFIAARLASALDYAHRKRDFEDRDMGLVHRDVSPQNVLLSLEGDVKLCDFGIAKAVSKAGQTQMGALKGKLQYMSPEQAWGRPVDARSDLFSLGAVLFEMLTGERLFTGDTEIAVLEAVRQGQIRPTRQYDPSIPAEVDEIVTRALAHEPQNRFASAGEMKQRIETVLHALNLSPGPTDLAAYVQRVLDEEPSSGDWSQLSAPAAIPVAPVAAPVVAAPEPEPVAPPPPAASVKIPPPSFSADDYGPAAQAVDMPDFADFAADPSFPSFEPAAPSEPEPVAAVAPLGEVHVEEPARSSRRFLYVLIVVLLLAAILMFFFLLRKPRTASPSSGPAAGSGTSVTQPVAPPAAPVAQTPAATPTTATKAPGLSQDEIERMVKEEMGRREAAIRRSKEAELEKYKKEIERMQAAARKKKEAADAAANEGEPPPQP